MGNTSLLNLLDNTYKSVLEKFRDDERLKAYWDIHHYLSDEDYKILNETDTIFYDSEGEKFAETSYRFYCLGMGKTVERTV